MTIYDADLEPGDFQKTPNNKIPKQINFNDSDSYIGSVKQFRVDNDEFHDFENKSEESENAQIAGHIIYKKRQREDILRQRVVLNPQKVKTNEIAALYKIIMLGDSGCGKTSMLLRFCEGIFNPLQNCTIGVDFKMKQVKVDGNVVKLQLWDTAGQERFQSISQAYLRNAQACIAVYDITRRQTFSSLESQITDFLNYADNMGVRHELQPLKKGN